MFIKTIALVGPQPVPTFYEIIGSDFSGKICVEIN